MLHELMEKLKRLKIRNEVKDKNKKNNENKENKENKNSFKRMITGEPTEEDKEKYLIGYKEKKTYYEMLKERTGNDLWEMEEMMNEKKKKKR